MTFFNLSSPFLWLSFGLGLILLELLLPGVYLFWIGLAALLVAIPAAFIDLDPVYLALLFVLAMAISVGVGMKVQSRKKTNADTLNQGLDAYLGTGTTVAESMENGQQSVRIYLAGTTYRAVCHQPVNRGDRVKIIGMENGVFLIEKVNYPALKGRSL